jgi:hypothetical protein
VVIHADRVLILLALLPAKALPELQDSLMKQRAPELLCNLQAMLALHADKIMHPIIKDISASSNSKQASCLYYDTHLAPLTLCNRDYSNEHWLRLDLHEMTQISHLSCRIVNNTSGQRSDEMTIFRALARFEFASRVAVEIDVGDTFICSECRRHSLH